MKSKKAERLNLKDFVSIPMKNFWITSFAFFICFFAWFGVVPFMPDIVQSLNLSPEQKYNSIILAVSGTIISRLFLGNLCDKFGPRLCYTFLLLLASIPLFYLFFVESYLGFVICRFFIGFIGASFVITQYHTSLMFAGNCVGIANATSAGWGNLGGGANRLFMPILGGIIVSLGASEMMAWRWAMVLMGILCLIVALLYFFLTQDMPEGNFKELREKGETIPQRKDIGKFSEAIKDYRVLILFLIYGACFGVELTVYGCMDDYLQNKFGINRNIAGYIVLSFALMNIFARTLGGYLGDFFGKHKGLKGRVQFLALIIILEGLFLSVFSQINYFYLAIGILIIFSLCVQMAEGATFAVVPFVNKKCLGSVIGIVGAGGNLGAVLIGSLLKWNATPAINQAVETAKFQGLTPEKIMQVTKIVESNSNAQTFLLVGILAMILGILSLLIRFPKTEK